MAGIKIIRCVSSRTTAVHSLVPSFSRLSDVQLAVQLSQPGEEEGSTEAKGETPRWRIILCSLTTRGRSNLFIGCRETAPGSRTVRSTGIRFLLGESEKECASLIARLPARSRATCSSTLARAQADFRAGSRVFQTYECVCFDPRGSRKVESCIGR